MRTPSHLPNLLVDEGARRLALLHLDSAVTARCQLTQTSDPDASADALHDYRVALRRLRSCLRAYRRSLQSTVTRRSERRLRCLARNTGRSRDLDVQLVWLSQQHERASAAERVALAWIVEELTAEREGVWQNMLDRDRRLFRRLHRRLLRQLTELRTTINPGYEQRRSTAVVTARRVHRASRCLSGDLEQIRDSSNVSAIHRARISAKRLRYLLEPFATLVAEGKPVIEQLKALQDGFGETLEARVFATKLGGMLRATNRPMAPVSGTDFVRGLETLIVALEEEGERAFHTTSKDWLGDAAVPFVRKVDALAVAIARLADSERGASQPAVLSKG